LLLETVNAQKVADYLRQLPPAQGALQPPITAGAPSYPQSCPKWKNGTFAISNESHP
jgi:hypothetical protein